MQPIQTSSGMWNAGRVSDRGSRSILEAFFPAMPPTVRPVAYPIQPLGGPFRRWHLTPWQTTEATAMLDDLSGRLGDDSTDSVDTTDWTDVLNTGIKTAGNIYGASKGLVPVRPMSGQYLPPGSTIGGMSTSTLLLAGAALLGVVLLAKK